MGDRKCRHQYYVRIVVKTVIITLEHAIYLKTRERSYLNSDRIAVMTVISEGG